MQVKEKEMYHFHNNKVYNELWVPGNEIIVDDNFETSFLNILKFYSTAVNTTDGGTEAFNSVINGYLKEDQDKETLIKLLKEASHLLYGANLFKREMALEEVRKQKYPNLPSRKHSIWLCDNKGVEFWKDQISHNGEIPTDLYRVLVTGNLFKSSDSFLPNNYSGYETNLLEAEQYWNPVFENDEQEQKAEYLFQGKLKILEKVK